MKTATNPIQHFTYGEYRRWPAEERWELIDGVAYDMCPAPSLQHQEVLGELFRQTANFLLGKPCRAFVAPFDVRLPEADETDDHIRTVVQPDLVVVCDSAKLDKAGCRGAPDWVVEVISPHTASKDHIRKRALYERHGVKEYWLVYPSDSVVTRYLWQNGRFDEPSIGAAAGNMAVTCVPGLEIDWTFLNPQEEPLPGPRSYLSSQC
ncbi:MAG: Uma2 family endonuclease [Methylococcaceae bacterium]|nr:MAG: Uma2 family endonuclease [Methylococcaceae bacterium]